MGNLTSTERQIAIAAGVVVILSLYALIARWGGFMFVTLLAGLAALVILYLPAIAPNMKAPGSKGSLLMLSGVLAALFWLLAFLYWLSYIFSNIGIDTILFLVGFAASLWLGWLCWSAFQAEGGKFQFGNTDMGTGTTAAAAAPPPATPPAEAAPPPPAAEPVAAPPPAAPPPAAPMAEPPAAPPPAAAPPAAPPPAAPADSGMGSPADSGMSTPADSGMGSPPSGDMGSGEGENQA